MTEDLMSFDIPSNGNSIIKVIGVGGGGGNAVSYMYNQGIKDVSFVICNTDNQALESSPVPLKIRLGAILTEGTGAGNKPEKGKQSAIENLDEITKLLNTGTKMVFITAGMGGGTGTGAAPVIAKAAKDLGILTVGIVTIPFRFEGNRRIQQAMDGISELGTNVDCLLVINNEKIREIYGNLKFSDAFSKADEVLCIAARGIAEIITDFGKVNVDFADVHTTMHNSGVALMGAATAGGENRALRVIEDALSSPLLNNNDINGAKNILLNIVSGTDECTMDELVQITEYVQEQAGYGADLIWGHTTNARLGEKIGVTIIATGFKSDLVNEMFDLRGKSGIPQAKQEEKVVHILKNNLEFGLTHTNDFKASNVPNTDLLEKKSDQKVETFRNMTTKEPIKMNMETIEEYEGVPAYVRANLKIDHTQTSSNETSKFRLVEDEEYVKVKENAYLHNRAD